VTPMTPERVQQIVREATDRDQRAVVDQLSRIGEKLDTILHELPVTRHRLADVEGRIMQLQREVAALSQDQARTGAKAGMIAVFVGAAMSGLVGLVTRLLSK
jgi:uncharacterized membrane protein